MRNLNSKKFIPFFKNQAFFKRQGLNDFKKEGVKFFDSHCHLQFDAFDRNREEIISQLIEKGSMVANVGSSIENSKSGIDLACKYPNVCVATVGVHPFHSLGFEIYKDNSEAKKYNVSYPQNLDLLETMANEKNVKAIGECGIDFSYLKDLNGDDNALVEWKQKQIDCFKFQIGLAIKTNKPLILHIRKDYLLALNILEELNYKGKAIFHFFKGKWSDYEKIRENKNYYFGFSNIINYDESMDKIIKDVDLDKILIETDAPYVPPIHLKGEINRPENVYYVAEKIANLKQRPIDDIFKITYENAVKFFNV